MTLFQIAARFIPFIHPPTWTEEIVRYFFIWMVFFGVSYNIREKEHIRVEFLINKLFMGKGRFFIHLFINIIIFFFSVVAIVEGSKLCFLQFKTERMITSLPIPLFIISTVIPLSFAFSALHIMFDLFGSKKGQNQ